MKRIVQYLTITLTASVLLSACQTATTETAQGKALDDTELTALISGNTIDATNSRGKQYSMYFGVDGSLENSAGESGSWEVKDGSICNTYSDRGFAGCDKVFSDTNSEIFYITPSGKTGYIHSTSEGNSLTSN